jgi:hypothetical protein
LIISLTPELEHTFSVYELLSSFFKLNKKNNMNNIFQIIIGVLLIGLVSSCDDFLDVNANPNQLVEIPSGDLLLKGTMLANTQLHKGHLLRSSMYYSGGLIGNQLVQQTLYNYDFTPGDSDASWSHLYNGILTQNKEIRRISPELDLLQGIIDINEAMAMGTAATIWGDVPYLEATPDDPSLESSKPKFDDQLAVYAAVQNLLSAGITKVENATTAIGDQDVFYAGDKTKWVAAANTLKARNYMLTKNYDEAIKFVDKGISSSGNTMNYNPIGTVNENSNLFYILGSGSRAGDMTGTDAFFQTLLDPANASSRNHAKTDETARRNYMYISGDGASANGIDAQDTPMPLVSYEENLLIWTECLVRGGENQMAIDKLNELRAHLNSGNAFNLIDVADTYLYDAFEMADFMNGGIENSDGIATDRAILREIIEERYVSGFTTYLPFDDVRRLRKSDSDVMVPIPLNNTQATVNPQRLLYPRSEIDNNENVPNPLPDLFTVTKVNG